jgi:hypothetical protein
MVHLLGFAVSASHNLRSANLKFYASWHSKILRWLAQLIPRKQHELKQFLDRSLSRCPNFVWINFAGLQPTPDQGGKINSNPSPLDLPPCRPDEVVIPHIHVKIPNGSTARPCANEP